MARWTLDELSRLIDHTNIHADATEEDLAKLCDEAKEYHFKMVAINQVPVKFCSERLAGTDIDTGDCHSRCPHEARRVASPLATTLTCGEVPSWE